MMNLNKIFILALFFFVSALPARADDAVFVEYRNGAFAKIMAERKDKMKQVLPCKGEPFKIKRLGYEVVQPILFGEGRVNPKSGVWMESVDMLVCGERKKTRYFVMAQNGAEPRMLLMLPGDSKADPMLQRDAMMYALIAVASDEKTKACNKRPNVVTTKYQSRDDKSGAWVEDWTVDVCGSEKVVVMTFQPDKTGTTISTKLKK